MSPDMVEAIISFLGQNGSTAISVANATDGPPKPLALGSSDFIHDDDFPEFWSGLMLMFLAAYRRPQDQDFYEGILINGLGAPEPMARAMAAQIETWDPIGRKTVDGKSVGTVKWIWRKAQEYGRELVNYVPKLLGINWENDQKQDFDLDRLYEIKLLGRAANELATRTRLMKGQERMLTSMGLAPTGDVTSNPVDQAEIELISTAKPLMGAPLPLKLFGALRNFVKQAQQINLDALESKSKEAGFHGGSQGANPITAQAAQRLINSDNASVVPAVMSADTSEAMGDILQAQRTRSVSGLTGDVLGEIAEAYGDVVAGLVEAGDLESAYGEIANLAGEGYESTGDPNLDTALATEALDELGDVVDDLTPEIGGLFTRARINKKMRKAAKRTRKNVKRKAKRTGLAKAQAALNRASYIDPAEEEAFEEEEEPIYQQTADYNASEDGGQDMSGVDISAGLEP